MINFQCKLIVKTFTKYLNNQKSLIPRTTVRIHIINFDKHNQSQGNLEDMPKTLQAAAFL